MQHDMSEDDNLVLSRKKVTNNLTHVTKIE
jgi:hypothetical protein